MNTALDLRREQASAAELMTHFLACDPAFLASLRARTSLPDYASKLHARALRFEAWSGGRLAGLLAVYHDSTAGVAYISNVSVLTDYCRQGVASQMLTTCLAHARQQGLRAITLEVARDNQPAIALYHRHGFSPLPGADDERLRMQLQFRHP
ncbi:GNAT family N-acetyltransferase [Janthinobacterium sp. 75]|uniref:GNAT family N-acetyltransferase n=1 Tax=Janthinobacterium sp. 75 TaxID=2135628 RepID=UPI001063625B|nr:GNAT family N-acetyltransferase [Janthinobacterium sp. 75]TDY36181.1 acetyltransferase (GNAT) family protein [Janthinobacterium sp. 75]